jgi:tyrosyl-tRNA synthetase
MDFLRMFGKDARNGTMLASDSRRRWLESKSGISFTELCFQQHAD